MSEETKKNEFEIEELSDKNLEDVSGGSCSQCSSCSGCAQTGCMGCGPMTDPELK